MNHMALHGKQAVVARSEGRGVRTLSIDHTPIHNMCELVQVRIDLGGGVAHEISIRRSLTEPAAESVDDRPSSFAWTGRHDGGPLTVIPSPGHYPHLVVAIAEARDQLEAYMKTQVPAPAEPTPRRSVSSKRRRSPPTGKSDHSASQVPRRDGSDAADDHATHQPGEIAHAVTESHGISARAEACSETGEEGGHDDDADDDDDAAADDDDDEAAADADAAHYDSMEQAGESASESEGDEAMVGR